MPEHLQTEPRLGVAFLVAIVLLLATGVSAALRPTGVRITCAAAILFAGLIAAYIASRTAGIPLLQSDPEPLDAVGVATNLVEALGFACAFMLIQPSRHRRGRPVPWEVSR